MSRYDVELSAADLEIGQDQYIDCVFCGRAKKMGISRVSDGVLYNCFSTACDSKGFIPSHPDYNKKLRTVEPKRRRWIGRARHPKPADLSYFENHFGIHLRLDYSLPDAGWDIQVTHNDEYLFPIRSRLGDRVGEVVRQPSWPGCLRSGRPGSPKANIYKEHDAPRLDWHRGNTEPHAIVLVEDQVSAEKVRQVTGHTGVALLGNTMNDADAALIAKDEPEIVFIWLDADMSDQAFKLNAKYGQLYKSSRVIFTEKDPKDLSGREILEQFAD